MENIIDERAVIGCVLIDSQSLYLVYKSLKPEMFTHYLEADIFNAMLEIFDAGESINVASIFEKLEGAYEYDVVCEELAECAKIPNLSTEIKSYAKAIEQRYYAVEIRRAIEQASLTGKNLDEDIALIASKLEQAQTSKSVGMRSMTEIAEAYSDGYFKEDVTKKRINTGFYKLDALLGGLEGGDVTVIGARPAVGKSALTTQIIRQISEQGYKVGYFNLEMSESQVYERMMANIGGIKLDRMRNAKNFLDDEEQRFKVANEKIKTLNVTISSGSKNVSEIKAESRHQDFDLIIIDYLQLLKNERNYSGNRAAEVGAISKAIKGLAMELNIPIIVLSQLNRVSERTENKEPTMSELRESGDIEQDASQIILLWNLNPDNITAKGLVVCKNRMGKVGKIGYRFDGDYMKFEERLEDFYQWERKVREHTPHFQDEDDDVNEQCPWENN